MKVRLTKQESRNYYIARKKDRQDNKRCLNGKCTNAARDGRLDCQACADKAKNYHELHRDSRNNNRLKFRYGISLTDKMKMYQEQGGLCRVCENPLSFEESSVDHDHNTGDVRALLHMRCNIAVSYFENDLTKKVKKYLSSFIIKENDVESSISTTSN
jgi:hypothetical protein